MSSTPRWAFTQPVLAYPTNSKLVSNSFFVPSLNPRLGGSHPRWLVALPLDSSSKLYWAVVILGGLPTPYYIGLLLLTLSRSCCLTWLRTLSTVLTTTLCTAVYASSIERTTNDVIAHTWKILNTTTTHEHDAVLL